MNLQRHHVVSDITGVTGMKILRAIVAGERDPSRLAEHRDVRCKASVATIIEALTGHYRSEHVFALRQAIELYDAYQTKVLDCDAEIERCVRALPTGDGVPALPRHVRARLGARRTRPTSRSARCCTPCSAST